MSGDQLSVVVARCLVMIQRSAEKERNPGRFGSPRTPMVFCEPVQPPYKEGQEAPANVEARERIVEEPPTQEEHNPGSRMALSKLR